MSDFEVSGVGSRWIKLVYGVRTWNVNLVCSKVCLTMMVGWCVMFGVIGVQEGVLGQYV